tara:strand:- start:101 stop:583 length:483 start_codon:yes stop_codon:yes gene_type:complete
MNILMNWYRIAKYKEQELGVKRNFNDLEVNVENPAGTIRNGVDPDGHEWNTKMKYDYGFVYNTEGTDGDSLDVYLGPNMEAEKAYVVHQVDPYDDHKYDEDKVMLGFEDLDSAKKAYLDHYDRIDFLGEVTEIDFEEFKEEVETGGRTKVNWKTKGDKVE